MTSTLRCSECGFVICLSTSLPGAVTSISAARHDSPPTWQRRSYAGDSGRMWSTDRLLTVTNQIFYQSPRLLAFETAPREELAGTQWHHYSRGGNISYSDLVKDR